MEYLDSIQDSPNTINQEDIKYIDLFEHPEFFYGNITNIQETNFCKYPEIIQEEMHDYQAITVREMNNYKSSPTGVRLRFHTTSNRLIFKVRLKRKEDFTKMNNYNSSGFDIYTIIDDSYKHLDVFSPGHGHDTFVHEIETPENGILCIFLPNYNTIEELYLGLKEGSTLKSYDYPLERQLPILFYGNAVTQGASASRSGNTFVNIVSRKLDRDIINISCSSCCKATINTAKFIGRLNCHTIVIDYTQNAYDTRVFSRTHERFYRKIREFHPDTHIILLTSENFNFWRDYDDFDEIVSNTYNNATILDDNVSIINQREIFEKDEYDYASVDKCLYNDYGMYKIADAICEKIINNNLK